MNQTLDTIDDEAERHIFFILQKNRGKCLQNACNLYKNRLEYGICRCGEIGRRAGLKILWTNHPCRFESDHRHHSQPNLNPEPLGWDFYIRCEDGQLTVIRSEE